jgi:hypothetical protein
MRASPALRREIERWAIEPLVSFLTVLTDYAAGGWTRPTFTTEVESRLADALDALEDFAPEDVATVANGWVLLVGTSSRDAMEASLPAVIRYLRDRAGALTSTEHVRWGLVLPIALYWTALARLSRGEADVGKRMVSEIAHWLASVPLPPNLVRMGDDKLADELARLRASVFSPAAVRQAFADRLLEDSADIGGLSTLLASTGYLSDTPV